MKILIFLFFVVVVIYGQKRSFKRRHRELSGTKKMFDDLEKRLMDEGYACKKAVDKAKSSKNKAHSHRLSVESSLKGITKKRMSTESRYNYYKGEEEKWDKKLRAAEEKHKEMVFEYKRTFRVKHKELEALNHELVIIFKIRKLLGIQHTKNKYPLSLMKKRLFHSAGNDRKIHQYMDTKYLHGRKRFAITPQTSGWLKVQHTVVRKDGGAAFIHIKDPGFQYKYIMLKDKGGTVLDMANNHWTWDHVGVSGFLGTFKMKGSSKWYVRKPVSGVRIMYDCKKNFFTDLPRSSVHVSSQTGKCLNGAKNQIEGCGKYVIWEMPKKGKVDIVSDMESANGCYTANNHYRYNINVYVFK